MPARVARAGVDVVGDRHRGDGRQVRGPRARDEELRDAGEGDAAHSDLAALDPALRAHGLHRVVAIEGRGVVEEVERAAGAARAAHLDAHHGEADQRCDQRAHRGRGGGRERVGRGATAAEGVDHRLEQVVRGGRLVAGVLDDRREGPVRQGLALGQAHGHRDLHAVAHAHVVEALLELLALVERRSRIGARAKDPECPRALGPGAHDVPGSGLQLAEDLAAEGVGGAGVDHAAVPDELEVLPLLRAEHVGLVDAAAGLEGSVGRGRRDGERGEQGDHAQQECAGATREAHRRRQGCGRGRQDAHRSRIERGRASPARDQDSASVTIRSISRLSFQPPAGLRS